MENRPRRSPQWSTVLGPNTEFTGTLKTREDVRLEDIFTGTIIARGQVEVGRNATLDGNLYCETANIAGLIRGNIAASTISVTDTGRVLGDLQSEKLITEDEAFIEGTITLLEAFDLKTIIATLEKSSEGQLIPAAEDE